MSQDCGGVIASTAGTHTKPKIMHAMVKVELFNSDQALFLLPSHSLPGNRQRDPLSTTRCVALNAIRLALFAVA